MHTYRWTAKYSLYTHVYKVKYICPYPRNTPTKHIQRGKGVQQTKELSAISSFSWHVDPLDFLWPSLIVKLDTGQIQVQI